MPTRPEPDDNGLRTLLRSARPEPTLPPRFAHGVWRRIERLEPSTAGSGSAAWLERLIDRLMEPRLAMACLGIFLLAGALRGVASGRAEALESAQLRYLSAVAPSPAR